MTKEPHQETQCVHCGGLRDAATGGINSPIYTSTAADYLDRDRVPYQRYFNTPNQEAVVRKVCALKGAEDGVLFSSGMAAISTLQAENRPFFLPVADQNPSRQRRADVIDHARQRVKMIVKKAW